MGLTGLVLVLTSSGSQFFYLNVGVPNFALKKGLVLQKSCLSNPKLACTFSQGVVRWRAATSCLFSGIEWSKHCVMLWGWLIVWPQWREKHVMHRASIFVNECDAQTPAHILHLRKVASVGLCAGLKKQCLKTQQQHTSAATIMT